MNLYFRNWCFSPGLITSLLAIGFFTLFVFLGCWQLERAEQKRNLFVEFENRQLTEAMNLNQVDDTKSSFDNLLWRPVIVSGRFLEDFQILLDNQVQKTKAGYYIYTPFQLLDSERVVLVNRGWLAVGSDRKVSPNIVATKGTVKIKAIIKEIPKTGLLLKELPPEEMKNGFYRVQRIDLAELEELTSTKLLPYVIRLSPESEHGYYRKWPLPGSGEDKHNGYAFQWFAFATVLFIIYFLLNIKLKDL